MQERRWWLYCKDLEFAREKQWQRIFNENKPENQAKELAIMTYLGLYEECERTIIRLNLTNYKHGRDALCRARREVGAKNTWESLVDKNSSIQSTLEKIEQAITNKETLYITLVGGIGDQLEAASLILGQVNNKSQTDISTRMKIRACGNNNDIVNKYLLGSRANKIMECRQTNQKVEISYPLYRYWHEKTSTTPLTYEKLYDNRKKRNKRDEPRTILVCWRCKKCEENPLSSFSRSLPFQTIIKIMNQIRKKVKSNEVKIIDITSYTEKEKAILKRNQPNIQLEGENITDIEYTTRLLDECQEVVSVDTSLVHIAATSNYKVHTLLPLHSDERWHELMNTKSIYKSNVVIHKQLNFHDWETPIRSVINKILDHQNS